MPQLSPEDILSIDHQHIWHPYSSFIDAPPVYPVASANRCTITLSDGRELLDGMSSWWSTLHGYNHPVLNEAVKSQLEKMSHIMFGGLTHEPAAKLAKLLVDISPAGLNKVFFSDSGSVAVEVALKMALQYWHSLGQPRKNRMLALRNGYHGDTIGAMSVCDPDTGMHHLFKDNVTQQLFAPAPVSGFDIPWEDHYIEEFRSIISEHHQQLAAVILEPIVQGTGGMRFYPPEYLRQVKALCQQYDVLLIADEIATGLGRTGKLFACEFAGISPDILCLGKTLTGGYMTMAATLCNDRVSNGICQGEAGVFMHGPTFMANPLAAAASLASIELLLGQDWQANIVRMSEKLISGLSPCSAYSHVEDVRVLGGIGVVEMKQPVNMATIQSAFIDEGIWVRPFGKLVYVMPPYIMTDSELDKLTAAMCKVISDPSLFEG